MTKHRMTKAVLETIRYIALESQGYDFEAIHAGGVKEHLEDTMEKPLSESAITRILQQLAEDGILEHHNNRTDWFKTQLAKDLRRPFYSEKRRSQGDSPY